MAAVKRKVKRGRSTVVEETNLERFDVYFDKSLAYEREIVEYLSQFRHRRRVADEMRRLLMKAIQMEQMDGRAPVKPVKPAPKRLDTSAGAKRPILPAGDPADDMVDTAADLISTVDNFLNSFASA